MTQYITVKELAHMLQISRGKAYKLLKAQDFPYVRIGRSIRIPRDLLDTWIEEHITSTRGHDD